MKEMNIDNEEIFDKYVKDFNYKDYIVYNYLMVDVNDESNKAQVKKDIESKIENVIAVTDIKD